MAFIGSDIAQKAVFLVDLLRTSFGILICFYGVRMVLGPPLSGKNIITIPTDTGNASTASAAVLLIRLVNLSNIA